MARLQLTGLSFARSGATITLTTAGTSASWSVDPGLPTIAAPDYMAVTVEPGTIDEEVIHITAHTATATTSTVIRNAEPVQNGLGSVAHTGATWAHAIYPFDANITSNSKLLGSAFYNPVSRVTTAATATVTALDTTHLRVTFVAPMSGMVLVKAQALIFCSANTGVQLYILEGAIQVGGVGGHLYQLAAGSDVEITTPGEWLVTGLTPGSTHAYDLAIAAASGSPGSVFYGGSDGPAVIEIWDGGISQSVAQGTDLLAYMVYNEVDFGAYTVTSTSNTNDLDATNLQVTFTAPASGKVIVELNAAAWVPTNNGGLMHWGLEEGGAAIGNTSTRALGANSGVQRHIPLTKYNEVTGLIPGSLHTYKWTAWQEGTGNVFKVGDSAGMWMIVRDAGTGSGGITPSSSVLSSSIPSDSFVVNPTPTSGTLVPGSGGVGTLNVVVPGVTIATNALVSFYVAFTKTNTARFMVSLDGTIVPLVPIDGLTVAGDPQVAHGSIPVTIPGDGAAHTIGIIYSAVGDTNAITFKDRSLTVVMSGLGVPSGDTAWTVPTLQNSWSNFGSGYATAAFRKLSSGLVVVKAVITHTGSSSAAMFTLPAGYRPLETLPFTALGVSGAIIEIDVTNAGVVLAPSGSAFAELNFSFFAEQ